MLLALSFFLSIFVLQIVTCVCKILFLAVCLQIGPPSLVPVLLLGFLLVDVVYYISNPASRLPL
jgi:hypothetical protein